MDSQSSSQNGTLSAERYRFLFEHSPAAVYSIDAVGVIQDFNHCAARIVGALTQVRRHGRAVLRVAPDDDAG